MQYIQRETCLVHARAQTHDFPHMYFVNAVCLLIQPPTNFLSEKPFGTHAALLSDSHFLLTHNFSFTHVYPHRTKLIFYCPVTPHEHYSYISCLCVYVCVSEHFIRINTRSTQTLCGRCDRILYETFINYYLLLNVIKVVLCLNKNNTFNRNRTSWDKF